MDWRGFAAAPADDVQRVLPRPGHRFAVAGRRPYRAGVEGGLQAEVSAVVAGEETSPPALTQFVRVPLRASATPEWRQWTAVYYPTAVSRRATAIDVILYLHGHRTDIPGARRSIWAYLKHKCWPLREHLEATGKAAVLIAPTLGPRSETGTLLDAGGLDRYLEAVLAASKSYWQSGTAPAIRHLIFAGHSGAGRPIRVLANSRNRAAGLVKEVWGFDCTYSALQDADSKEWSAWAQRHPSSKLCIFFVPKMPTQDQAVKLRNRARALGLSNVSVVDSRARRREGIHPHFWVPIEHWRDLITASPHLRR